MRFWDLSSPDVAEAEAEPWGGLMSGVTRPTTLRAQRDVWLGATILSVEAGVIVLVLAQAAADQVAHPTALRLVALVVLLNGLALPAAVLALPARTLRRLWSAAGALLTVAMGVISTVGIWAAGPEFGVGAIFYLQALPFAFFALRPAWALLMSVPAMTGCAVVMFTQDGWAVPWAQWVVVATTVVAVAAILGIFAGRAERLAASEHAARVELADVNRTLEERVATQVAEIERLGALRRFLSPQVADAVLSGEAEATTRPHRARIAVLFCDLRGFTAFTKESEPEEVIADLDQYYRTVGEVLQRHGATIGGYAGDGIMAYLGDPVPHPEPARAAVQMVADLRGPMDDLVAEWQRRGHDLNYGIGLAYGYTTLGVVGFDGRYDYTPLGGVVNLAARLCGRAAAGQVLMDHPTYAELDGVVTAEPVDGVELKGLGAQRAYSLT